MMRVLCLAETGPDPWSFEETCLQLGEAHSSGTTALSKYEVRVVVRVEGGLPWGVNAGGGSRFQTYYEE